MGCLQARYAVFRATQLELAASLPLERVPGASLWAHYVTLLRRLQGANTGFSCSVIVGAK